MDPGSGFTAKVREASGVADWYHHAHRDTAATWLGKAGYDDFDQKLVLKHSNRDRCDHPLRARLCFRPLQGSYAGMGRPCRQCGCA